MNDARTLSRPLRALLALLVLASAGCDSDTVTCPVRWPRETHSETTVRNLDFAEVRRITAATHNGHIRIGGRAATEARLEIVKTVHARTLAEAERIAGTVRVECAVRDGEAVITATYPDPGPGVTVAVDYDLLCPARAALQCHTDNGDVHVTDTAAGVRAAVMNGRIRIVPAAEAEGALRATVVNGSVSVDLPADGAYGLSATTINGCIRGRYGDDVVDQCLAGLQNIRLGADGDTDCDLYVVNGTIEFDRPAAHPSASSRASR